MRSALVVYRLLLRLLFTRARLLGLGAVGLVGIATAAALGRADVDHLTAGVRLVDGFGVSLLAPLVVLVFASASLGDLVDDATLVHLWLRPVPAWAMAAAAWAAGATLALPLVLVPMVAMAALSGAGPDVLVATIEAAVVAGLGYAGVFTWLGLRTRRSLVWGLVLVLIWEGFVARVGGNVARLTIRSYARSVLADGSGVALAMGDRSMGAVAVAVVVAAVGGWLLTARRLQTIDVP